jgi:hypothetical protein
MNKKQQNEIGKPLRDIPEEDQTEILIRHLTSLRENFDAVMILSARTNRDGKGVYEFRCSGHPLFLQALLSQANQEYVAYPEADDDEED